MIGILVQLVISWLVLWLLEKSNLSVLGFMPTRIRILDFFFGLVMAACCFAIYSLATTALSDNHWVINDDFTFKVFLSSFWWTLKSVLFEELIFRGALLYILLKKSGLRTACLISATAFGIYHWFSFGVLGNPIQMTYVFFSTGFWGFMYALSFAKTRSLYLPVGLHLGWNFVSVVVFSQGPIGQQWLIASNNGKLLTGFLSLAVLLLQIFLLPLIVYFYLRRNQDQYVQ